MAKRPPEPPSRLGWWLATICIVGAIGGVAWWQQRSSRQASTATARAIRTAPASRGAVERTIRLSGSTASEFSASLTVPIMRGSRSGMGRDRGSVGTASAPPTLSTGSNSNGPVSTSSASSSSGSGGSMSSALRASTSRLGSSASSASKSSSTSSSSSASTSMGSSGIGSTASDLQGGGGGGGGGGGDFAIVLQKLVKPGTLVKKGTVVAELDRQNMLNRLDDYRAAVIQTQASVSKLKADLAIIREAHAQSIKKAKGLLEKAQLDMKTLPVLSAINSERARLAVQEAELRYKELLSEVKNVEISLNSQIRNAEISLQQSNIELKRAEANADRMIIKAPIDGLTVMSTIPRGGDLSQIQEGDQLYPGLLFMSIVDPRSMIVNATVNQSDVESLRIGAKARVRFDAYPGLEVAGRVYSVGGVAKPGGQRASYVKEIPVRLKLEQVDPRIIPDLSASADVTVETDQQASVSVPLAAIFSDGPSHPSYVFVQSPGGWIRRSVELGLRNHIAAAVRSGLKEQEVVALELPPKAAPE